MTDDRDAFEAYSDAIPAASPQPEPARRWRVDERGRLMSPEGYEVLISTHPDVYASILAALNETESLRAERDEWRKKAERASFEAQWAFVSEDGVCSACNRRTGRYEVEEYQTEPHTPDCRVGELAVDGAAFIASLSGRGETDGAPPDIAAIAKEIDDFTKSAREWNGD